MYPDGVYVEPTEREICESIARSVALMDVHDWYRARILQGNEPATALGKVVQPSMDMHQRRFRVGALDVDLYQAKEKVVRDVIDAIEKLPVALRARAGFEIVRLAAIGELPGYLTDLIVQKETNNGTR